MYGVSVCCCIVCVLCLGSVLCVVCCESGVYMVQVCGEHGVCMMSVL